MTTSTILLINQGEYEQALHELACEHEEMMGSQFQIDVIQMCILIERRYQMLYIERLERDSKLLQSKIETMQKFIDEVKSKLPQNQQ